MAVSVPVVSFPIEEEARKESMKRAMLAKNVVLVAFVSVVPPEESMTRAVVVAPAEGTATTWKRFRFESEEVAARVRTLRGEVVPMPTRVAPAV